MSIQSISPSQLNERCQQDARWELIDVRTPAEFREVHALMARNLPLDRLVPSEFLGRDPNRPLFVICKSGGRSRQACEKLVAAGCQNVVNVEGGTLAWELANLPVVRGQKTISLERQVRIAAGFLVLCGSVLGYLVRPEWIGLSAFVGAGLLFSGVTDTCGMALLLGRMPWNQVRSPKPPTALPIVEEPMMCSLNSPKGG